MTRPAPPGPAAPEPPPGAPGRRAETVVPNRSIAEEAGEKKGLERRQFVKRGTAVLAGGAALVAGARRGEGRSPSPAPVRSEVPGPRDVPWREFDITVELGRHELLPGVEMHALMFNGTIPGPEIRVQEGEWVRVRFTNRTELLHTIHWHGLYVPYSMDGVPYVTQPPVMPGKTFTYEFQARPYGTHFYHCHFGTVLHMQSAMHGAFIVERDDDPIRDRFPYTRDYTLILESFDTNFTRRELNAMLERMKQRLILMRKGRLDPRTLAVFDSYDDFLAAVEDGWIPPYVTPRRQPAELPEHNFFAINGKSYPATEPIRIREGEWIRIRLINAGEVEHYMHLHRHDFLKVADDGAPLPAPVQMNTIRVSPGKTADIVLYGNNPGYWTFHDHDTTRVTNNGLYPGGALTVIEYEGFRGPYTPKVSLDQ